MQVPLYRDGAEAGTLERREEGLYDVFSVRCTGEPGEVLRCWAVGEKEVLLGVLEPVGGGYALRRRCSRNSLKELGTLRCGVLRAGEAVKAEKPEKPFGWTPCSKPGRFARDPILLARIQGASGLLVKSDGREVRLALPWRQNGPLPCEALFCLLRPAVIGGGLFLVLRLEKGVPVPW